MIIKMILIIIIITALVIHQMQSIENASDEFRAKIARARARQIDFGVIG